MTHTLAPRSLTAIATLALTLGLAVPTALRAASSNGPAPSGARTEAKATLSWSADNGNGTYTNPLFYDEFSDPDVIRVGEDYYLAGTTMHCVPGLVVLHSKDLVNWDLCSYCFDRWSDILPDEKFRLSGSRQGYGQGVWAPVIRYHDGTFYVFTNVNGNGLQLFTATDPRGPWQHRALGGHIYDLSVLFDDDGTAWAIHGYDEVKVTQFKPDFSGYVEGSERVIIPRGSAMGEGHHAYKVDGMYYIISAEYSPMGRSQCARSKSLFGPYETATVSALESLGTPKFPLITNAGGPDWMDDGYRFNVAAAGDNELGCATVHQGGMLQTAGGQWWAVSMLDFVAVGRTVCLVPVTWQDGWPVFGLEGNPGRSPRTWLKPEVVDRLTAAGHDPNRLATSAFQPAGLGEAAATATSSAAREAEAYQPKGRPSVPYERSDAFDGRSLARVWQWNHDPIDGQWALRSGKLRINAYSATNMLWARGTLTQRAIGPVATATVTLSGSGLREGDVAGLGLLNLPYAWVGLRREGGALRLQWMQQTTGLVDLGTLGEARAALVAAGAASGSIAKGAKADQVWLRVTADLDEMWAQFAWSADGRAFHDVGDTLRLPYQLRTFQGSRYSLFCYHADASAPGLHQGAGPTDGAKARGQQQAGGSAKGTARKTADARRRSGGYAEFDDFTVDEPMADRTAGFPAGRVITLDNLANGTRLVALRRGLCHSVRPGDRAYDVADTRFRVHDRGLGRVVLEAMNGMGYVTVVGLGLSGDVRLTPTESEASLLQWQDMLRGQCMLMSLTNHRYVGCSPDMGEPYSAQFAGADPNRRNGCVFRFTVVE